MGRRLLFLVLLAAILFAWLAGEQQLATDLSAIDPGDTAWMLVSSALVLLMTPRLAFFYGGMVHRKYIISTMLQSFVALGVVTVVWFVVGFSLCFGESIGGLIGNPLTHFAFRGVGLAPNPDFAGTIPFLLFALFQLKFVIITETGWPSAGESLGAAEPGYENALKYFINAQSWSQKEDTPCSTSRPSTGVVAVGWPVLEGWRWMRRGKAGAVNGR